MCAEKASHARRAFGMAMLLAISMSVAGRAAGDEAKLRYRRDVLPLLSDRCFKCHGPDSASREAGLRLDLPDAATAELDSGAYAIVRGDVAKSALVQRIESSDPAVAMPPADSGKTLSSAERAILRRWVEEGAEYEPHWAYVAPPRPPVPEVTHPDLVRNPIDAFVLARLESEKLEPSKPASKERLIRRAYFDLIGLPPTLAEIDAFIADESADAFQRVVERLLQSPHYGERMAADWLDGARYADSNGYQNDFARNMSPWRDWVIGAFNAHLPYDQFVTEQLAGDLLPNPTLEQRIATGFNRNHRMVTEAGSIEEEWHVENVVDRVETAGTVFLGLTIGCARCHDHKFDPISQREFYQFYAFFNNVNEKGVYTETRGNVPPLVKVTSADDEKKLAEFTAAIAALSKQFDEKMAQIAPTRQQWITSLSAAADAAGPEAVVTIDLRSQPSARVSVTDAEVAPDTTSPSPEWRDELFGKTATFNGKAELVYSRLRFPPSDQSFSWAVWVKPEGDGAILSKIDNDAGLRGVDLLLYPDGKIAMHVIDTWPDNALKVVLQQPLQPGKWAHIAATYDGSKKATGVLLYVNGKKQEVAVEADQLTGTFATQQPFRIGKRSTDSPLHAALADVRLFDHALSEVAIGKVLLGSVTRALKDVAYEKLSQQLQPQFDELLLAYSKNPVVVKAAEIKAELERQQAEKNKYEAALPTTMVMDERAEPRETFVLQRGRYDLPDKEQPVVPDLPAVLPDFPADAPRNRLGLARGSQARKIRLRRESS